MYAAYENYIEPREKYLPKPEGHESLYEYLLDCHRRISNDIGDYTAFVTPVSGIILFGVIWLCFQWAMRCYRSTGS